MIFYDGLAFMQIVSFFFWLAGYVFLNVGHL